MNKISLFPLLVMLGIALNRLAQKEPITDELASVAAIAGETKNMVEKTD